MNWCTRAASVAVLTVLALAGCNGGLDEPDPIPTTTETASPGPDVSPPPEAPDLDEEQKAAFDTAVARYAEYQAFSKRVWQEPSRDPEVALELAEYTVMPETKAWSDSNDGLIEKGQYITGTAKVEWTVPVEVTENRVRFKQCESPGDWTIHEGEETGTQTNNTVSEVFGDC